MSPSRKQEDNPDKNTPLKTFGGRRGNPKNRDQWINSDPLNFVSGRRHDAFTKNEWAVNGSLGPGGRTGNSGRKKERLQCWVGSGKSVNQKTKTETTTGVNWREGGGKLIDSKCGKGESL